MERAGASDMVLRAEPAGETEIPGLKSRAKGAATKFASVDWVRCWPIAYPCGQCLAMPQPAQAGFVALALSPWF
jgi:hypothetical protein